MISVKLVEGEGGKGDGSGAAGEYEVFVDAFLCFEAEDYWVEGCVFFWFDVCCSQETILLQRDGVFGLIFFNSDDRVADVLGPDIQQGRNVFTACFREGCPEVACLGVPPGMLLDIASYSVNKDIFPEIL